MKLPVEKMKTDKTYYEEVVRISIGEYVSSLLDYSSYKI